MSVNRRSKTCHHDFALKKQYMSPLQIMNEIQTNTDFSINTYIYNRTIPNVCNFCLEDNHQETKCPKTQKLYHVTEAHDMYQIILGNLRESMKGKYGKGIYLGPPSMVYQFSKKIGDKVFLQVAFPKELYEPKPRMHTFEVCLRQTDEKQVCAISKLMSESQFQTLIKSTNMRFCPNCQVKYKDIFNECRACGYCYHSQ